MQIHEITKRHRTDEGILDTVKNKISDVKTKAIAMGDRHQEKQWDLILKIILFFVLIVYHYVYFVLKSIHYFLVSNQSIIPQ